jgi:virulence factor Mce-like protein
MRAALVRPAAGLASVAVVIGLVLLASTLFRGGFAPSVPVTVLSPRAGLVMNPDAKVTLYGVQVGRVSSIEELPDGQAAIHLALEPSRLDIIPGNVVVDIASTTVFGAKRIRLVPPQNPSPTPIRAGQTLGTEHVMLEINTIFEQLMAVLSTVQPDKLNETLGAIATALHGRGPRLGATLHALNAVLARINPHLDAINHDLATAPPVFAAYADSAPDLLSIAEDATALSATVVEHSEDLDDLLVSATGLGYTGNDVLTENGTPLTQLLDLLLPTTALTDEYRDALNCGLGTLGVMANNPPLNEPGVEVLAGFFWGQDRYRYPADLPKVAATGGPQCSDLPKVPYGKAPAFVVADTGANPWKYGNSGVMLNSDLLKQILFGPIDGPPRNSAQIGHPG